MLARAAAPSTAPATGTLGGGDPPDIEVSATSFAFGEVHVFGGADRSLTISNQGPGYLNVDLYLSGAGAPRFFVNGPPTPFQIAPGGQEDLIVSFYPNATGSQEASLELASNDPVDPSLSVSLSGNGYEANLLSLTGTPDPVLPNGTLTFTLVLDAPAGPGDVDVEVGTTVTALILVPPVVTVPQGQTQVQFTATAGPDLGTETVYAWLRQLFATDEIHIQSTTGVGDRPSLALSLGPVVPGPTRRQSVVAFTMPASDRVRLTVFDVRGRSIATLADGVFPAGRHEVEWRATTGAGMYFLRLETPGATRVLKAIALP
jgi:hypothetical protein